MSVDPVVVCAEADPYSTTTLKIYIMIYGIFIKSINLLTMKFPNIKMIGFNIG